MAALEGLGVKSMKFDNVPGRTDQKMSTWLLTLQSASDTLYVPEVEYTTTSSVKAWDNVTLAGSITATRTSVSDGTALITITGGTRGDEVVLTCMHRRGTLNNMAIDPDPT